MGKSVGGGVSDRFASHPAVGDVQDRPVDIVHEGVDPPDCSSHVTRSGVDITREDARTAIDVDIAHTSEIGVRTQDDPTRLDCLLESRFP